MRTVAVNLCVCFESLDRNSEHVSARNASERNSWKTYNKQTHNNACYGIAVKENNKERNLEEESELNNKTSSDAVNIWLNVVHFRSIALRIASISGYAIWRGNKNAKQRMIFYFCTQSLDLLTQLSFCTFYNSFIYREQWLYLYIPRYSNWYWRLN